MNHSESDKYALQKVEIRNNIPLDEAEKHYKKITKRKPRKVRESTNFYQFRFLPPTKFESRSFRTNNCSTDAS
jgi:CRISPR/Cas system-associated protein Cas7 (RAMP superfamily)